MKGILATTKVACLVNPKAANSKWLRRARLHTLLLKILSCQVHDDFGEPRTTTEKAREACQDCRVVVAMGGDGTVADVILGIMESGHAGQTSFGVIPFGSGNAFRKSFGIPKNPKRAVKLLDGGNTRKIDLMETCGRFATFASIGATALITGEKLKNKIHGLWGHLIAGVKIFSASREVKTIMLEEGSDRQGPFLKKTIKSPFLDCIITKTNYFGYGWLTAPYARVDDGYLDINLFEMKPLVYLLLFPLIYSGIYQRLSGGHYKARRAVISGKGIPIQINGEFIGNRDQIEFRVVPRAINMIVPDTKQAVKYFTSPN